MNDLLEETSLYSCHTFSDACKIDRWNNTCGYAGMCCSTLMEGDGVSEGAVLVGGWLGLLAAVAPSRAVLAVGVDEGDFPEASWDLVKVTDLF